MAGRAARLAFLEGLFHELIALLSKFGAEVDVMLAFLSHVPLLAGYLIGALSIMVGGIFLVGAFVLSRPKEPSIIPSLSEQALPPPYKAKRTSAGADQAN
jgi:hypothetical protein